MNSLVGNFKKSTFSRPLVLSKLSGKALPSSFIQIRSHGQGLKCNYSTLSTFSPLSQGRQTSKATCNGKCMGKRMGRCNCMLSNHSLNNFSIASFHSFPSQLGKKVQFNLADIGEGITEVELLEWFVKEGQHVNEFDEIVKVQSDKATVDITSRYDGTISKLHYNVGDIAKVGEPLVEIELEGDDTSPTESTTTPTESTTTSQSTSTPSTSSTPKISFNASNDKVLSTPAVRHLARKHNLDLSKIPGTGKSGRVMKEDVLYFLGELESKPIAQTTTVTVCSATTTQTTTPTPSTPSTPTLIVDRVEPIRGLKRTMVKTMNASNLIPTLQLMDDIILDNLIVLRDQLRPIAEAQGLKLTFMPFFIKSVSLALKEFPIMNARINSEETEITYLTSHNIGFAMDTPNGLLVPNIKNCQEKSILEIAEEMQTLQKLGKEGLLGAEALSNGTFSLSNIGAIGGTYATPLINPPESAIVALGKMRKIAVFNDEGAVVPQNQLNISVSADHRFIDGATVGKFINKWKLYLESPNALLLALK